MIEDFLFVVTSSRSKANVDGYNTFPSGAKYVRKFKNKLQIVRGFVFPQMEPDIGAIKDGKSH